MRPGGATLIALASSKPPAEHVRRTMNLSGEALVVLGIADSIVTETVRRTLRKTILSTGQYQPEPPLPSVA